MTAVAVAMTGTDSDDVVTVREPATLMTSGDIDDAVAVGHVTYLMDTLSSKTHPTNINR